MIDCVIRRGPRRSLSWRWGSTELKRHNVRAGRVGYENPPATCEKRRGIRPQAQRMDSQGQEEERPHRCGQARRAPQGRLLQGGPPPRGGGDGQLQDSLPALRPAVLLTGTAVLPDPMGNRPRVEQVVARVVGEGCLL